MSDAPALDASDIYKRLMVERFTPPPPRKPRPQPRTEGNRALWVATNEARPLPQR